MNKNRIRQINELVKRELGAILNREIEIPENSLVTIIQVETTSDLEEAKVWISIFPFSKTEEIFKYLERRKNHFRNLLSKKLKRLKILPKIILKLDQTEKRVNEVQKALDQIES